MVQGRYFVNKKTAKAKTYIPHLKEWVLRPKGQSYKRSYAKKQLDMGDAILTKADRGLDHNFGHFVPIF